MARSDRAGHVARKRFGQHFLTDPFVIDAIVDAIDPQPGEALVEIGPGLGALTNPLVARCGRLTVIELDRDLAARLRRRPELDVIEADVLTVDLAALAGRLADSAGHCAQGPTGAEPPPGKLRMVGNLPYNISTPILFHLLEFSAHLADQHFMLQKEVVDRMVAVPGSKAYGRLTVMLQWRCTVEAVLDVPPQAFDPPPRVDSAVVRLQPLPADPLAVPVDVRRLGELVSVAFSQRRKILRGTLGRWLDAQGFAGFFDVQRRAEEVPVAEYVALSRAVSAR